jgi:hypothetical protein
MKTYKILFALLLVVTVAACSPTGDLVREPVYIGETEVSAILTDPPSISLHITGDLPTACHAFNYEYEIATGRIDVTIFSTISPAATCIQGLSPFDETVEISMVGQPDGAYQIYLNGELVGEINLAGAAY